MAKMKLWAEASFLLGYGSVMLGIFLFSKGFMTSKPVSDLKSDHLSEFMKPVFDLPHVEKKKKFVILVIDALRTDFVLPTHENIPETSAYLNKFSILQNLARSEPRNAKLFKFVADPPTATTQRLGGITAGTLPSFVEAFENFAGETLLADNFVYQLLATDSYKKLHFMGDDTWIHLYPFMLEKSAGTIKGYHSFHLFDLHSVDNGIKEQLFPTLKKNDYQVVIAHFLGLDHCGHKFGPLHQDCGQKLSEMNSVIGEVISHIDEDTTLIIFGDHGMTEEGDHGGNTPKEISSVLFTYSKEQRLQDDYDSDYFEMFSKKFKELRKENLMADSFYSAYCDDRVLAGTFSQIDFASTFSVMANIPIPFGNLGAVIPDVFFGQFKDKESMLKHLVNAYRWNSHQLLQHFKSVNSYVDDFEPFTRILEEADMMVKKLEANPSLEQLQSIVLLYYQYLQSTLAHCRTIWAKYHFGKIYSGLVLMGFGSLILVYLLWSNRTSSFFSWESFVPLCLFFVTQCLGKATNSFIIFEDSVIRFVLVSLILFCLVTGHGNHESTTLMTAVLVRFLAIFKACREEHGKGCCAYNHRAVSPSSFSGYIFILCVSFGLLMHTKLGTRNAAYLLATFYQVYGWLHESMVLNEWLLQIAIPRTIWTSCVLMGFVSIFKGNKSDCLFYVTILLSTFQRPFGGWVLLNAGSYIFGNIKKITSNCCSQAVIIYTVGMCLFFWTAHHAVLSNIHWEAGFVGFTELNQIRASIFLGLNTFGGPILAAISVAEIDESLKLLKIYTLIVIVELFFDSLFIIFLLRHLMLWTAFTPRFLMQAAMVIINIIVYVIYRCILRSK